MRKRVEFADQAITVLASFQLELRNESFNEFAAGTTEGLCAAKLGGVSFDQGGIEVVLTDQEAKLIPQARLPVVRSISRLRIGRR
jgi:hypothetical protein